MLGSDVLDVAIGLSFLYFITSLIVTAAREWIEGLLQMRAVHLERGIREILQDKDGSVAKLFFDHPQIGALFRGIYEPDKHLTAGWFNGKIERVLQGWTPGWLRPKDRWPKLTMRSNLPAYIPARNFALAILDLSARGGLPETGTDAKGTELAALAPAAFDDQPLSFAAVRAGVQQTFPSAYVQRLILTCLDTAQGDLEQARTNLEKVFDSAMDRGSGWYRKDTQTILFLLGLVAAIACNIDTIRVASELYRHSGVRQAIVAQAQGAVETVRKSDGTLTLATIDCAKAEFQKTAACGADRLQAMGYPVGWDDRQLGWSKPLPLIGLRTPYLAPDPPPDLRIGARSVAGWILTALALMLGAPFWFDVLNKLMVIRSTVKPHEKSPEESSEDRQSDATPAAPAAPIAAGTGTASTGTPAAAPAADDPNFVPLKWAGDPADPQEGDL